MKSEKKKFHLEIFPGGCRKNASRQFAGAGTSESADRIKCVKSRNGAIWLATLTFLLV